MIEVLISIGLAGIVIFIIFSIYFTSNKIYNKTTNQSSVQQDVRIAADYITRELRSAKVISINENEIKGNYSEYYALMLKTDIKDDKKYLYRKSFNTSSGSTEIKIGSEIYDLKFLPASKKGMLKLRITDDEKDQNYNLEFEFSLDNINDIVIPETETNGAGIIYYVKN